MLRLFQLMHKHPLAACCQFLNIAQIRISICNNQLSSL